VDVRIAFDRGKPAEQTTLAFARVGGDPAPQGTNAWLREHFDGTKVQLGPVDPGGQIMHHKYVIRDGALGTASVWTGSTNFTDDAWTHQENNIITVANRQLAAGFERDFDQLWTTRALPGTGVGDGGQAAVGHATVGWTFAPGEGPAIDHRLAALVAGATSRVRVASMVLTSRSILHALVDAAARGVQVTGIYDAGQMGPIVRQWRSSAHGAATADLFESVAAHLAHKRSAPYSPTGIHNFLHDKVLVLDEATVATGSFNLSSNATRNAENSLVITDPAIAHRYATSIDTLVATYHR
jgi:phosphatidylserine/phosphatidylglycerophosphate/cardiolipin synthase-like enzyme